MPEFFTPAVASWSLLAAGCFFAWVASNIYRSVRFFTPMTIVSFMAGWIVSESVPHQIVLQVLVSAGLVQFGALGDWPGQIGLGLAVVAWLGMLPSWRDSHGSRQVFDEALRDALGDYEPQLPALTTEWKAPFGRGLMPLMLWDPRVKVHKNIRYAPGAGPRHLLDVHVSKSGAKGAPVLLQIHGGGWFTGSKEQQAQPLMGSMTAEGWICVALNYRLSPRSAFPAHLIDVKLCIAWIKEHIAEYGGDPEFIAVTGGSAGGHLASLAALTANDPEFQPDCPDADTTVQAAVPLYGVYDVTAEHRSHEALVDFASKSVWQKSYVGNEDLFRRSSPVHRVGAHAPPFFVVNGDTDSFTHVEGARYFVDELRKVSQQPVAFAELRNTQHNFDMFHSPKVTHACRAIHQFLTLAYLRHQGARAASAPQDVGAIAQES